MLEGQFAGVQVGAQELVGRLEHGTMGELWTVRTVGEVVG